MKRTTICQGCWEQMHVPIAIRGPLAVPFKLLGIKKSRMHPNLCTICESMFTRVKKRKQIPVPVTVLFADIRGYTDMSQHAAAPEMNQLLHTFYDECSAAVWDENGIVNKFIGDAVLAIFNFPLVREDHIANAVKAAVHLQERCQLIKQKIGLEDQHGLCVGVGVATGECFIGEVGTTYKDFTAIGSVVNLASRLQGAASAGEIVMTKEVFEHVKENFPGAEQRSLSLKGVGGLVESFVLRQADTAPIA